MKYLIINSIRRVKDNINKEASLQKNIKHLNKLLKNRVLEEMGEIIEIKKFKQ